MRQKFYNPRENNSLGNWLALTSMRLEFMLDHFIFKPLDLTVSSFRILALIYKFGPQTPSKIIELIGSTKSNITQRLNFLNRQGFVDLNRKINKDKRKVLVDITPLGLKKIKTANNLLKKYNFHIENYFSDKEIKNFLFLLRKLNQGLDKCETNVKNIKKYNYEKN